MASQIQIPPRPPHVGVLAMEVYFPSSFVAQEDLEAYDEANGKANTKGK